MEVKKSTLSFPEQMVPATLLHKCLLKLCITGNDKSQVMTNLKSKSTEERINRKPQETQVHFPQVS